MVLSKLCAEVLGGMCSSVMSQESFEELGFLGLTRQVWGLEVLKARDAACRGALASMSHTGRQVWESEGDPAVSV